MSVHFLHTKLRARDLERAIAFYRAAFGYELRKRKPGPDSSELAFLRLPGEDVELQLAYYPDQGGFEVPPFLLHLAFRVSALALVLEAAVAAGGTLLRGPYTLPSGSEVAFVRDPEGYELELIQKPTA